MKADCSAECAYTHRPKSMQYFLPASKIEGCDKWLNFETGEELTVEGHPVKDPNYKPQVYEIAPPPPNMADDEDDDGRAEISASYTTPESEAKKAVEAEAKEAKEEKDIKDTKDTKDPKTDAHGAEGAEAASEVKKDEL